MAERQFYKKADYERIDFIIKTLGENKRQMELAFVLRKADSQYHFENELRSEQYYDHIVNWLELDLHLIRRGKNLVELTEEGIRLYEENIGIEAYIKNIRDEKRLAIRKLKLGITHKWILIVSALLPLVVHC